MTHTTWAKCLALLASAYPKEPMAETQSRLYYTLLQEYDDETVARAVLAQIEQSPWFPRVSELRDRILAGPPDLDAEAAWGMVMEQVRQVGWQGSPTFPDPRIPQTLRDLGWVGVGWQEFCASTNPEADRAHFVRWYRQAAVRDKAVLDDRSAQQAMAALMQRGLSLAAIGQGGEWHG